MSNMSVGLLVMGHWILGRSIAVDHGVERAFFSVFCDKFAVCQRRASTQKHRSDPDCQECEQDNKLNNHRILLLIFKKVGIESDEDLHKE